MRLKHCSVEWTEFGCVTRFHDGSEAEGYPALDDLHYRVISHRCGYGDDLLGYCREHDLCHSLVEEVFYDRPSRVLMAVAKGVELSGTESAYEEMAVQVLQRWIRTNERPILSGVDWDDLKQRALELMAG